MLEAIILAGGFGTRLRSVVPDLPKPMAPIAGKPFLEILLHQLSTKGFERIVLSLGFLAEKISSHFGTSFEGMQIAYEIESKPLGTGGAILAAMTHCQSDHVYVFNGDTYLDLEIQAVENLWDLNHNPVIVVREVYDTSRYGRVDLSGDLVVAFKEKGEAGRGLINAGCYVLKKNVFDGFRSGEPFSLESDLLAKKIPQMILNGFVTSGHFIDIGIPEDFARAQTDLANL
jgi:D-glycero-alpha-D-manno-heptose 1-phosphate guanylyltransferase